MASQKNWCPDRLQQALIEKVTQNLPLEKWSQHPIVLAVSGGADSVGLLRLGKLLQDAEPACHFLVAHANHQLRGSESDGDEDFVRQLAQKASFDFSTQRLTIDSDGTGDGLESALRKVRYRWLGELARELGARYVMTAHTANDQVETVLFRILRGTGIKGLAGIPAVRELCPGVTLARPMLGITREEVESLLESLDQTFRTDSSNFESNFARNKIRNELIPLLNEEYSSDLESRMLTLACQATRHKELLDSLVEPLLQYATITTSPSRVEIQVDQIADQPNIVIGQMLIRIWEELGWPLRDMTFEKWDELANAIKSKKSSEISSSDQPTKNPDKIILNLPGDLRFECDGKQCTISGSYDLCGDSSDHR